MVLDASQAGTDLVRGRDVDSVLVQVTLVACVDSVAVRAELFEEAMYVQGVVLGRLGAVVDRTCGGEPVAVVPLRNGSMVARGFHVVVLGPAMLVDCPRQVLALVVVRSVRRDDLVLLLLGSVNDVDGGGVLVTGTRLARRTTAATQQSTKHLGVGLRE